jgi:hypothetical protein
LVVEVAFEEPFFPWTIAIKPTPGTSVTSRQVEVTAQLDIIA